MIKKYLSCLYSSFIKVYTQKNLLLFHHKYVKFFLYKFIYFNWRLITL